MKPSSDQRLVSFCFDDGYAASVLKTAALFEERERSATFCIVTDPRNSADPFIRSGKIGDFELFRELAARGHEVMPHGHRHIDLSVVDLSEAQDEVSRCLDIFAREMPDIQPADLIYHCAFNRLPPALQPWLRERVRAVRASATNTGMNLLPHSAELFVFDGCFPLPPSDPAATRAILDCFLEGPSGWLVLCFHGLDGEGWGPITSTDLASWLDTLIDAGAKIAPAGAGLNSAQTFNAT